MNAVLSPSIRKRGAHRPLMTRSSAAALFPIAFVFALLPGHAQEGPAVYFNEDFPGEDSPQLFYLATD